MILSANRGWLCCFFDLKKPFENCCEAAIRICSLARSAKPARPLWDQLHWQWAHLAKYAKGYVTGPGESCSSCRCEHVWLLEVAHACTTLSRYLHAYLGTYCKGKSRVEKVRRIEIVISERQDARASRLSCFNLSIEERFAFRPMSVPALSLG